MFKKYYIVSLENDTQYLCKHKDHQKPRVYWSKFEHSKDARIKFTLFGAYLQKFTIWILASDIVTDIYYCND